MLLKWYDGEFYSWRSTASDPKYRELRGSPTVVHSAEVAARGCGPENRLREKKSVPMSRAYGKS